MKCLNKQKYIPKIWNSEKNIENTQEQVEQFDGIITDRKFQRDRTLLQRGKQ